MDGKALLKSIRGRPIDLVPARKVLSLYPGEWTSPFEGKGFEARGHRDFVLGDNPRHIHLPTSARRSQPTIVERVALRDFKLMVVVDDTPSMRLRQKWLAQLQAAALLLYSAWQAETTFGLAVKAAQGLRGFGSGIGSRHFYRLYRRLLAIHGGLEGARAGGRQLHLGTCLPPNAMVLFCSDFLDERGGIGELPSLLGKSHRYDFVPLVIQDDLEYSFPLVQEATWLPCRNPETGLREALRLTPQTARALRMQHEERFARIAECFHRRDHAFVHVEAPGVTAIRATIGDYFRQRRRSRAA